MWEHQYKPLLVCYSESNLNSRQFVHHVLARWVIWTGHLKNGWSEYWTSKSLLLWCFHYSDVHFSDLHCIQTSFIWSRSTRWGASAGLICSLFAFSTTILVERSKKIRQSFTNNIILCMSLCSSMIMLGFLVPTMSDGIRRYANSTNWWAILM